MPKDEMTFMVEDAKLKWLNFAGRQTRFKNGVRTFSVILNDEDAKKLAKEGWNVKFPDPNKKREEGEHQDITIPVEVGYKKYPPTIVMFTSRSKVRLGENDLYILDEMDIGKVDLICRAGFWTDSEGSEKIKAWLKTLVVFIREDYLMDKYDLNNITVPVVDDDEPE